MAHGDNATVADDPFQLRSHRDRRGRRSVLGTWVEWLGFGITTFGGGRVPRPRCSGASRAPDGVPIRSRRGELPAARVVGLGRRSCHLHWYDDTSRRAGPPLLPSGGPR